MATWCLTAPAKAVCRAASFGIRKVGTEGQRGRLP
ncbi:MAG: hypothetical protein RLZZ292_2242, partial [Bacteroidota bacterium]